MNKDGWIEVTPGWNSNLEIIDVGEQHYRRKRALITYENSLNNRNKWTRWFLFN
jgi:hypothetical protein